MTYISYFRTKGSHLEKKPLTFGHCLKWGGGGPTRIKMFWGSFVYPSFGHYGGKRGGLNLFQKCWGSFEVVFRYFLGCFEVVFGGMFFPKSD